MKRTLTKSSVIEDIFFDELFVTDRYLLWIVFDHNWSRSIFRYRLLLFLLLIIILRNYILYWSRTVRRMYSKYGGWGYLLQTISALCIIFWIYFVRFKSNKTRHIPGATRQRKIKIIKILNVSGISEIWLTVRL